MPPKNKYRSYRQPRTEKQGNKPVVFGPEPPPKAPPATVASASSGRNVASSGTSTAFNPLGTTTESKAAVLNSSELLPGQAENAPHPPRDDAEERGEAGKTGRGKYARRKKLPRKKIDDKMGGWDEDHVERPLDEADQGRYSPHLPWDLRLLRCCDEFRSLRSLGQQAYKVNYESVLRYFRVSVKALRLKYGHQPLRGYDPEGPADQDDAEEGAQDSDGGDAEDDDDAEKEGVSEREWAEMVLKEKRLAKYFENRAADHYSPTLRLAPLIMKSLLRFMLDRAVFPAFKPEIEALLPICDTAKTQLGPASRLLKELRSSSTLVSALAILFPDTSSSLASPIKEKPDPEPEQPIDLPDTFSNVSLAGGPESDDEEIATSFAQVSDVFTWAKAETTSAPLGDQADPEAAMREHADRIKKQFEREAERVEAWTERPSAHVPATTGFKSLINALDRDKNELEGVWLVGSRERSARMLTGWNSLGLLALPSAGSPSKRLAELSLGPCETEFPLTTMHFPPPSSTLEAVSAVAINSDALTHQLTDRLNLIMDLPLSHDVPTDLHALQSALFEADFVQLIFVPTEGAMSAKADASVRSVWLLETLYRVIPTYWPHAGELLRREPGEQMTFEGPYERVAHEVLARIMELPESGDELAGEAAPDKDGGMGLEASSRDAVGLTLCSLDTA